MDAMAPWLLTPCLGSTLLGARFFSFIGYMVSRLDYLIIARGEWMVWMTVVGC